MSATHKVARAARQAALARDVLHLEIRKARTNGASLRAIAEEARMSYETVRRICEQR